MGNEDTEVWHHPFLWTRLALFGQVVSFFRKADLQNKLSPIKDSSGGASPPHRDLQVPKP